MKTKKEVLAMVEIAVVLCSVLLVALPSIASGQTTQEVSVAEVTTASEDDYVLDIYGNANEDDTIDMRDLTYVKLIFFGKKPETELADAKYDGKINPLDFIQIKLIIVGKEKEITIVDVLREAETVHKPVKRIVVLATESAEVLRALNAEDKVVGVATSIRERPGNKAFLPELSKLPGVGSSWRLDYEAVLNLDPDVLLPFGVWSTGGAESKREYKEKLTGVTIISLDLTRPDDFAENVRKLGYILDKEEEAEMLINWLDEYDNKIKSRTEGLSDDEKPQVFLWCFYTLGGGYRTACKGNNIDRICNIAGGRNIAADLPGGWWPTVDPEWVVEQNPDIIVTHGGGAAGYHTDDPSEMKAMREEVMNRPELANVNAVKNRKVYTISTSQGGLTSGAGSLIAIAYYGKWLHPDLFVNLDPQAIHQEYLDKFHKDLNFNVYEHGVFVYPEPS